MELVLDAYFKKAFFCQAEAAKAAIASRSEDLSTVTKIAELGKHFVLKDRHAACLDLAEALNAINRRYQGYHASGGLSGMAREGIAVAGDSWQPPSYRDNVPSLNSKLCPLPDLRVSFCLGDLCDAFMLSVYTACGAAFVAAPGQGKTTAAQGLLWELQKDSAAFGRLDVDMQAVVNNCCQQGLVWRCASMEFVHSGCSCLHARLCAI